MMKFVTFYNCNFILLENSIKFLGKLNKANSNSLSTEFQKNLLLFFVEKNNVFMVGSLKASIMGFVLKILNMYFF